MLCGWRGGEIGELRRLTELAYPLKVFLTKGVGRHKDELHSFETALKDAGIAPFNIVTVSSILPPGCEMVSRNKGLEYLKPGQVLYCVMSRNTSNEPNRLVAASVGCAVPADSNAYGYLSEHHCFGKTEEETGEYAEDLAASMLASTLGIEFDVDQSWDEREQLFKISGKIVKTTNVTQSAVCDKTGLWTTVIAVAVFVCDDDVMRTQREQAAAQQATQATATGGQQGAPQASSAANSQAAAGEQKQDKQDPKEAAKKPGFLKSFFEKKPAAPAKK